jgi:hypothetical protein
MESIKKVITWITGGAISLTHPPANGKPSKNTSWHIFIKGTIDEGYKVEGGGTKYREIDINQRLDGDMPYWHLRLLKTQRAMDVYVIIRYICKLGKQLLKKQ